jgi:chromosome segregation ATPase
VSVHNVKLPHVEHCACAEEAERTIAQLRASVAEKAAIIAAVGHEKDELRAKADAAEARRAAAEHRAQRIVLDEALTAEVAELRAEVERLADQVRIDRDAYDSLTRVHREDTAALTEKNAELTKERDAARKVRDESERRAGKYAAELETADAANAELTKERDALDVLVNDLQGHYNRLQPENVHLRAANAELLAFVERVANEGGYDGIDAAAALLAKHGKERG